MANEIDNRIVGLGFDNTQFEAGVSKSLGTLGKLKDALAFKGASSGLDSVQKSISNLSFDALTNGLNKVGSGFNAFEQIAIGALRNVGAKIENLGSKLINTLVIGQVKAGWAKYGEVTQSVQTIMAATGDSIDNVTGYVEKLNWFTDETSYSLTDMTNNISRFTSAGIGLDKATKQMQGIAAAAALAGQGASTASHAMSGFAKAMAAGYMSTINWNWIQTSKMDTLEFKQQLIEAAVAEKQLRKVGSGANARYYTGGTEVTAANMRETLSKKWLNTATMERALQVYGNFSDELGELYSLLGDGESYTTNDILKMLDQFNNKSLDLNKIAKLTGVSVSELDSRFSSLTADTNALGRKAFEAAQQAVTLRQAWEALTDAVSTGWMKTWTLIFGNYEEAKELWTDLANFLYGMFAEGGNRRNNLLGEWHILDYGGYNTFKNALEDIMNALSSLKETADTVFRTFFPGVTVDKLADWTVKFGTFARTLKESFGKLSEYWEELHPKAETFTTVLSEEVINTPSYSDSDLDELYSLIGKKKSWDKRYAKDELPQLISDYTSGVLDLGEVSKRTGVKVKDLQYTLNKFRSNRKDLTGKGIIKSEYEEPDTNPLKNIDDILTGLAKGVNFIETTFKKLREFVQPVVEPIKTLVGHLKELGGAIGRRFGEIMEKLTEKIPESSFFAFLKDDGSGVLVKIIDLIDRFVVSLTNLIDPDVDADGMDFLENMFGFLKEIGGYLWDIVQSVMPVFGSLIEGLASVFKGLGEILQSFFKDLNFETGTLRVKDIIDFIGSVLLVKLLGKLGGAGDAIDDIKKKFKDKGIIGTLFDWAIGKDEDTGKTKLKFLDTITEGFRSFADKIMGVVNKYTNINTLKEFANSILKIAAAIGILALLPIQNFKRAMWALVSIVAVIGTVLKTISMLSISKEKTAAFASLGAFFSGLGIAIVAFAASMAILSFVKPTRLIAPAMALLAGIVTMVAVINELSDKISPAKILATAAGIMLIGFAFDEIAVAMLALALIPWGKLTKSALFLVGMLAIIAIVVDKLATTALIKGGPAAFIATAGAIAIIAFAMDLMAVSIMALAILPLDKLAAATVAIGVLTIALGVLLALGGEGNGVGMVLLASSLLILAPAILILAAALIALSLVPFGKMMGGVLGLTVALAALIFLGMVAEAAAVGLIALGASVVMIGVGAIGVGIAIGIAALAIAAAISIINGSIGGMIEKLGGAFSWIKEKIGIFKGDIEGAAEDTGRDITKGTAKGMKDHTKEIDHSAETLADSFGGTFKNTALESVNTGDLMAQLSEMLGTDASVLGLTGEDIANLLGGSIENGMLSYDYSNIMPQILNGIFGGSLQEDNVEKTGHKLMKPLVKGSRAEAEIESPSKVYMRMMDYIVKGMEVGADNNEANISAVGAGMGRALVDATEGALTPLDSYRYNVSPSVSPVLDLSAVGGSAGLSFGATLTPSAVRSLGSVSADIRDQRESMNDYIDTAVQSAIEGMKDQLTFIVPLEVDGQQFAKSTAKFTRDAQNLLDRNILRKGGYTS